MLTMLTNASCNFQAITTDLLNTPSLAAELPFVQEMALIRAAALITASHTNAQTNVEELIAFYQTVLADFMREALAAQQATPNEPK